MDSWKNCKQCNECQWLVDCICRCGSYLEREKLLSKARRWIDKRRGYCMSTNLLGNMDKIEKIRGKIQDAYINSHLPYGGFDEILCYELHSQPVNPRLCIGETGLTFKELAHKWGISVPFLGELIADHCNKL